MMPTFREIEDADVPAVIVLWHESGVARPWNDPATDIAFARRGPHGTVLVAEIDGRVVASAMAGEDGHRGWLYYVAVAPDQQGTGLGRRMVAAAEAWLAARGVWKVQLLVRRENAAVLGFYDHLGYRDTNSVCLQKVIAKA
ncbi:GNAT family acetyltransferase [Methylobacterium nonmethylotrophicum]|uniref:GNAT family acetyltransferase n=1 Tax=Methylobacterium nonmethylotrophicum TaxID=1141884 RepID=A0A4Z0NPC9_9HYPH|nr:GNAT family acetyltransferase [Methylobacterium nonmethylotrophicum]TGD98681.1 GNAT family acetyltransferase [Methylobacterium nonmethylotrophicum]